MTLVEAGNRLGGRVGQVSLRGANHSVDTGGEILCGVNTATHRMLEDQQSSCSVMFNIDEENNHDQKMYLWMQNTLEPLYQTQSTDVQGVVGLLSTIDLLVQIRQFVALREGLSTSFLYLIVILNFRRAACNG